MGIEYDRKLCQYLFNRFGMKKDRKLLDVGCGQGNHVHAFRELGLHVWGVDKKTKGHKLSFCNLETSPLSFPDNTFDYVFCKSVVEHVKNNVGVLAEIERVLKGGGLLILFTPVVNKYWHTYPEHINPDARWYWGLRDTEIFYQFPFVWKYPFLKFIPKVVARIVPDRFRFHKDGTQNVLVRHSKEPVWLIWSKKDV